MIESSGRVKVLRLVAGIVLGFALSSGSAKQSEDIEAFKAAYSAYQQYLEVEDYEGALPEAKAAYQIGKRIYGTDHANTASLAYNYGLALVDVGEKKQAKKVLREALIFHSNIYGKEGIELISLLMDLGHVGTQISNPDKTRNYYNRALKITRKHYGNESVKYGRLLLDVGIAMFNEVQSVYAQKYLQDAYTILLNALGGDDVTTGYAAFQLARFEFAKHKYADAEGHLLIALNTFEDPERPSSAVEMSAHAWLVSIYEELGDPDKATAHCLAIGRMTPYKKDQEYLPIFRVEPKYPWVALQKGKEGYVDVIYTVDHEGIVRNPEIETGTAAFEKTSIAAVKEWRFAPRFVDGKPVDTPGVRTRLTFKFSD